MEPAPDSRLLISAPSSLPNRLILLLPLDVSISAFRLILRPAFNSIDSEVSIA